MRSQVQTPAAAEALWSETKFLELLLSDVQQEAELVSFTYTGRLPVRQTDGPTDRRTDGRTGR